MKSGVAVTIVVAGTSCHPHPEVIDLRWTSIVNSGPRVVSPATQTLGTGMAMEAGTTVVAGTPERIPDGTAVSDGGDEE